MFNIIIKEIEQNQSILFLDGKIILVVRVFASAQIRRQASLQSELDLYYA